MLTALERFARPICLEEPRWTAPSSPWHEHIPFLLNLTAVLEPRIAAGVGTRAGDGYCALCQAVESQRLATRCFAVVEPDRSGRREQEDAEAVAALRAHHDGRYDGFSTLLLSTSHEALGRFEDGSIDLLLLDGSGPYEALRDDLRAWSPKMSASGVAVLVGIRGRRGAPRLWDELKVAHAHFELEHAEGLGLAVVGSGPPRALEPLLAAKSDDAAVVGRFFLALGRRWALEEALRERDARLSSIETSRGYRTLHRLRVARDVVAPPGTARRKLLARITRTGRDGLAHEPAFTSTAPGNPVTPLAPPRPAPRPVRSQAGHCPVCDGDTRFTADDPWLRDHYRCERCGSIPRERALALVLRTRFPEWRRLRIHESSPGTPLSRRLAEECPGYLPTHFFPGVPGGSVKDGFRCEDLERQTFPDDTFDLVVTLDVFEHVLDPEAAFREIARTLAPGGAHVFTTPLYRELALSQIRARRQGDGIELLTEPEYHHNPVDPAGSLVTVHWGYDIGDIVLRASGLTTTIHEILDPTRGIEGEFLHVFVSCKAAG